MKSINRIGNCQRQQFRAIKDCPENKTPVVSSERVHNTQPEMRSKKCDDHRQGDFSFNNAIGLKAH